MIKKDMYEGLLRQKIMSAYIKHVLMAVSSINDPRGQLSWQKKKEKIKCFLNDAMSKEAMQFAKAFNRKEKVCNMIFKTNSVVINLIFGKALWFMQTRGKKVYEKLK